MRLRILISTVLLLVLGYSFFWFYMAGEVEDRIESFVRLQKPKGILIRYQGLDISGFPYRMDIGLKGVEVTYVAQGKRPVFLSSPQITFIAFPWKITQGVIFSKGSDIRIGHKNDPILHMVIGAVRASALVDLETHSVTKASFIIDKIAWPAGPSSPHGETYEAHDVKLHILRPALPENTDTMELPVQMKVYLEARNIISKENFQDMPSALFVKKINQLRVDLQIHGSTMPSYSKDSLGAWRDEGGTLSLNILEITSGDMDIETNGEVTLDQDFKPLGAFSTKVHGLSHIIEILAQQPAFKEGPGSELLQDLKRLNRGAPAEGTQEKNVVEMALSLQSGMLYIGSVPVLDLKAVVE